MRVRFWSFVIAVALSCGIATAQQQDAVVLVPLLVGDLPGAGGSLWSSELTVYNAEAADAELYNSCVLSACSFWKVRGASALRITNARSSGFPGQFLRIATATSSGSIPEMSFQLRIFDRTRNDDWGTEIPVVRWDLLTSEELTFIGIPVDKEFRHTIRIYTDQGTASNVSVEYFDLDAGNLLLSLTPPFIQGGTILRDEGYAQIDSTSLAGQLGQAKKLRVEVKNRLAGALWAMISVTNNQTQRVTIMRPHNIDVTH